MMMLAHFHPIHFHPFHEIHHMIALLIWAASLAGGWFLARSKGRLPWEGLILALILGPIGLLIELVLPPVKQ
jgi:hypothetical protein